MMNPEPKPQHRWLQQLVGEWTSEGCEASTGTESVRSLGDIWVLLEGTAEMPGGTPMKTLMTLGYDPETGRFVGTWVGSMMTYHWVYDGELDADERVLTLNAVGPDFDRPGEKTQYQDIIELKPDGTRELRARVLTPGGEWRDMMTTIYRRVG